MPGQLRTALPVPVLIAMSVLARTMALEATGFEAFEWVAVSVLSEAAFFGLLRPVELLRLRKIMVLFSRSVNDLGGRYAICFVLHPKNRKQLGRTQFAVIRNENTGAWA